MPKKTAARKKAVAKPGSTRIHEEAVPDVLSTPDPIAPEDEDNPFVDSKIGENDMLNEEMEITLNDDPDVTEKVGAGLAEPSLRDGVQLVKAEDGQLPQPAPGQQFFETPDGRIYAGPADQHSIPDPLNPRSEINPMRKGGINR